MDKVYFLGIFVICLFAGVSCSYKNPYPVDFRAENEISIVPKVDSLNLEEGHFEVNSETVILVNSDSNSAALLLKSLIDNASTFEIQIVNIPNSDYSNFDNTISMLGMLKTYHDKSYMIRIQDSGIRVSTKQEIGLMHAVQTLRQLFIDQFHSGEKRDSWYLPNLSVSDRPKFKHRGLLLDCSRHFFKKEVVKKYIDLLSLYKMNVLHWHLTEDQGWRIEIDAYPKLTEIGAWRTELDGSRYGGFYTKADIREIVAYAAEREVTIIPEIELPGHSQAAIAAYPHLSCTGEQVEVANDWGVFKEIYCAGNDSVFQFLETVLDEVLELFPSEYIHIGGDEAPKFRWEHCHKCQKRMADNGLKDEHELQSYFISRIEAYLNSKGRKLIGWDEILEGGLSANATVQSWRGMDGGIAAAKGGHNAIMSPTSHAYFDYDLKAIDLEKVYSFNPIPDGLTEKETQFIIGGECNMWTEHVPNDSVLDAKVFPRLLAMSEVLWSGERDKDYDDFYNRVQGQYPILKALGVQYGAETVPVAVDVLMLDQKVSITATPGDQSLALKYRWKCDTCKSFLTYSKPIELNQSGTLEFQAFKEGRLYGKSVKQVVEKHKALGELVNYKNLYNKWYETNLNMALVDGRLGSTDFKDGCWQGFWGDDIEVVIDLGQIEKVCHLKTHFYQYNNSWIFMPVDVVFEGSTDGKSFFEVGRLKPLTEPNTRGKSIEKFVLEFENKEMQYVRLKAKNIGKVPDWHEAAGSDAWLFIDEIVVK